MQREDINFRPPTIEDGTPIWQLVRDSGVLDVNSTYCYLILCKHFSDTCCVAEVNGEIVGFVTGYLPPGREDTLFIWQVGVSPAMRGHGLATRLLQQLLQRDICHSVRFVEATVGPSNEASRALFASLAKRLDAKLSEQPCFDTTLFPSGDHEPENLLHIGPFALNPTD
ncbi:MAG: diaminobutyrate acetyltransferase [Granulosicoccaceae bacterium]|jgi:L-2,4-diaminobutyric acid acetyltransferase